MVLAPKSGPARVGGCILGRLSLFLTTLLIAGGCITEPTCACTPAPVASALLRGTTRDPAGAPLAGGRVTVQVLHIGTCAEPGTLLAIVVSDTSGHFRHVTNGRGVGVCLRVWADPPPGTSWMRSDSQLVRIDYGPLVAVPDSVELVLQLRPLNSLQFSSAR